MRRWLGRLGLVLLLLLGWFVAANRSYVAVFPGILPAFAAKEYCSCRFVMGQDDGYCERYTRQYLPIGSRTVDEAARRVVVRATGATRAARWLAPREGCRLEP